MTPIRVLTVVQPLAPSTLSRLQARFSVVHYHPGPSILPADVAAETEVIYCSGAGLPENVTSIGAQPQPQPLSRSSSAAGEAANVSLPRLRHLQIASAGANRLLTNPAIVEYVKWLKSEGREQGGEGAPSVSTASGTHVLSIPPWVVGQIVGAWHQFGRMLEIQRNEQRWSTADELERKGEKYIARSLKGRTAGMLGYGALGRETARLLEAFGMRIVACNTSGKRTAQDGYIIPGTGDADASIPEAFYSTRDPASLKAFIQECDVLVASLPGTNETAGLLDAEKLGWIKEDGLFLNVGRGTLITSDELLKALDSPRLFHACVDVTDPEPLPTRHPLWAHPKITITPHLSGDAEGEFDIATDILLENVRLLENGEGVINQLRLELGY